MIMEKFNPKDMGLLPSARYIDLENGVGITGNAGIVSVSNRLKQKWEWISNTDECRYRSTPCFDYKIVRSVKGR
jgi:hypothetical protein